MTHNTGSGVSAILLSSLAPGSPTPEVLQHPEWEALWTSARDHCLVPYLHHHWTESGFLSNLPAAVSGRFATARYRNAERNRRLLLLLEELSATLRSSGVPVLVSKGLPLAQDYYGELGLRVMYDLDLIVKPRDRTVAFDVLRKLGYVPFSQSCTPHSSELLWRPCDYSWDAETVFDPEAPYFVELHTRPLEPRWHGFRLGSALDLWEGSRQQWTSTVSLTVPQEEKLLVHLAVHYARNVLESSARLMHLLDIVLLLRTRGSTLDWDKVLDTIVKCRTAPFCFLAIDLARRIGGCFIPDRVWSALRKETPGGIVNWLDSHAMEKVVSMNLRHRERSLIYFLHWHMAAGFLEKTSMLVHAFCSPWREATGQARLRTAIRRMSERMHYLAFGGGIEGGS